MQVVMTQINEFLEELYDGDFQVVFRKNSEQFYGFDAKEGTAPDSWYESRTISGEAYWIPYKSVRAGMVEKVDAQPLDGNSLDSLYFQQRSATPLPFTVENDVATVSFQGLPGEAYYLTAIKDSGVDSLVDHAVGLLNVVPYEQLAPNIVLVPLSNSAANGILASEIEQELQRIYTQAVVRPTVTLDAVFSPANYTPPLRAVNSGLLSNYTPQMNDIIGAYEDQEGYDPNAYYLFLTDDYEATDRAGFMPRGRRFGFLYMGNTGTGEALARTLAHEIGHGAFVLEHSFDAHPDHLPQHQTDNLMDYANGTHLYKWQWDLIHDPVNAPFLEGDGSGEYVTLSDNFIREILVTNGYASGDEFVFLNNKGDRVVLDVNLIEELTFATGGERYVGTRELIPAGSLVMFKLRLNETDVNTYVNCRDGSYVRQLTTLDDQNALVNPRCQTPDSLDIYPLDLTTDLQPVIVRLTKSGGQDALNVVKIDDYEKPEGDASFDFYLGYFFNGPQNFDYTHEGELYSLPDNVSSADLAPEYGFQVFRDFVEQYPLYMDADELSGFYMGALAFVFSENREAIENCSVREDIGYGLKAFADKFFRPLESPNTNLPPPLEISPVTTEIIEEVAPEYYGFIDESIRANYFNIVENVVGRIDLLENFQQALDNADASDLSEFLDLITNIDTEIEVCEFQALDIEYEKIETFFRVFFDTNHPWITRPFFNEIKYEECLLILLDKIDPTWSYDFVNFLRNEQTPQGTYLWQELIDRVDDSLIDNNGWLLLQKLMTICNAVYTLDYVENEYQSEVYDIVSLVNSVSTSLTNEELINIYEELEQKVIPYEYSTFLKQRILDISQYFQNATDAFNFWTTLGMGDDWSAYIETTVGVNEDGTIDIEYNVESARLWNQLAAPSKFENLDPFSPVIIDPSSSFRTARNFTPDQLALVPACVFYYLENAATTNTLIDGAIVVGSLAAVASGAMAPEGLTILGELIYTMETGAAVLELGARFADINQPDDPFLQELTTLMDMSAGAMGLTAIAGRASYWLAPTRIETITLLGGAVNLENALNVSNRIAAIDQTLSLLSSSPALLADLVRNKSTLTLSLLEVLLALVK